MYSIQQACDFLAEFAPSQLAEDWDNTGLLVGDATCPVRRIMTCLTVTGTSVAEAVAERADLLVSHHPFPFRPLQQITAQTMTGRLLLKVIGAGIAVYSPHTSFDSAAAGINQRLAEGLGLEQIGPLIGSSRMPDLGTGRWGVLPRPESVDAVARRVKEFLRIDRVQVVSGGDRLIRSVAVACGSAGQLLSSARDVGCELFVTGETNFHTCLEAQDSEIALVLPGHFASERFAVEQLAEVLARQFPSATVWACQSESDPLEWVL